MPISLAALHQQQHKRPILSPAAVQPLPRVVKRPWARPTVRCVWRSRVPKPAKPPTFRRIVAVVSQAAGVPREHLLGRSTKTCIARPRCLIYKLAHEQAGLSKAEIGRRFGQSDHSTVLHGIHSAGALIERVPGIQAIYEEALARLGVASDG